MLLSSYVIDEEEGSSGNLDKEVGLVGLAEESLLGGESKATDNLGVTEEDLGVFEE